MKNAIKINFLRLSTIPMMFILFGFAIGQVGFEYTNADLIFKAVINAFYSVFIQVTIVSNDYKINFEQIIFSLPIDRKDIIRSKYFMGVCLSFISIILIFVVNCIINLIIDKELIGISYIFSRIVSSICVGLIMFGIYTPLSIILHKSKIILLTIIFYIIFSIFIFGFTMFKLTNCCLSIINKYKLFVGINFSTILIILISIIIYYLSYKVSNKLCINKEF